MQSTSMHTMCAMRGGIDSIYSNRWSAKENEDERGCECEGITDKAYAYDGMEIEYDGARKCAGDEEKENLQADIVKKFRFF